MFSSKLRPAGSVGIQICCLIAPLPAVKLQQHHKEAKILATTRPQASVHENGRHERVVMNEMHGILKGIPCSCGTLDLVGLIPAAEFDVVQWF